MEVTSASSTCPNFKHRPCLNQLSWLICQGAGESRAQLLVRARTALQALADKHPGQRIICVTHGGFLHCCYRLMSPPSELIA